MVVAVRMWSLTRWVALMSPCLAVEDHRCCDLGRLRRDIVAAEGLKEMKTGSAAAAIATRGWYVAMNRSP